MRNKSLIAGLFCLFVLTVVFSITTKSQKPEEAEQDSIRIIKMKNTWVRVKFEIKTDQEYEYLQQMGIDCPQRGECEVVINWWQRKQLEKKGLKAKDIQGLYLHEGPNQVEYKLVREIDLKADGVESIVFGPKKDKSSALSEIILGLKDEVKGLKKVYLYDFNFNLIGEMHLRDVTFSKDLRYIGGIKYVKIPSMEEDTLPPHKIIFETGIYKFELFDYTGKKLWELEKGLSYDASPNSFSISNKGTVIERDHSSGMVTFYDQKGNEIKKIKVGIGGGDAGGGIGGGCSPMMGSML